MYVYCCCCCFFAKTVLLTFGLFEIGFLNIRGVKGEIQKKEEEEAFNKTKLTFFCFRLFHFDINCHVKFKRETFKPNFSRKKRYIFYKFYFFPKLFRKIHDINEGSRLEKFI